MKIVVTGGTGFIGRRVCRAILDRGMPLLVVDYAAEPDAVEALKESAAAGAGSVEFLDTDVSDPDAVMEIFRRHPDATHVIHLAYLMSAEVEADPLLGARINILGTTAVFEAAARRKLARVVFMSSEAYYGAHQDDYGDRDVTEDDGCGPTRHAFIYGVMKQLNEFVGGKYAAKHGIAIACLRPPVVFGHGRKRGSLLWSEDFISAPAMGLPVTLPFPPETRDCWLYVDDCAEQLVRLALAPQLSHFAYNAGGESIAASELAALIQRWIPKAEIAFDANRPMIPFIERMDGRRLAGEIGFAPRPLAEGVRAHLNEARTAGGLAPV